MRIAPSQRLDAPPDAAALRSALLAAERGSLLDREGRARGALAGGDLPAVAALLELRADVAPFQHWYARPAAIDLGGGQGTSRIELLADGSVRLGAWGGWAELARPRELFEALASRGLPDLASAWDAQHGPGAEAARGRFRAAVPAPFASAYEPRLESLVDASFRGATVAQSLCDRLGTEGALTAILAWYGAGRGPLWLRPEHESLPRTLLAAFGFDPVIAVMPRLRGEDALSGAARFLLDASPMPPVLSRPALALAEGVRRALVSAARATMADEDADRLAAELFPAVRPLPAAMRVLGHSETARLDSPVSDGQSVFARDGNHIVRFSGGARTPLLMVLGPPVAMAFAGGALWLRLGGVVKRLSPSGQVLGEDRGASPAQRSTATARAAGFRDPGGPPLPASAVRLTPSASQIDAYIEYSHLDLAEPAAVRFAADIHLDPAGKAVAGDREIALPGRPVAWDVADPGAVVVLTETADHGSALVWLRPGEPTAIQTGVAPGSVKAVLAAERRAFLLIDDGRGVLVAAFDRP